MSQVDSRVKPSLLLCEDQIEFARELKKELSTYYDIETCDDLPKLVDILQSKQEKNNLPDILLLDLFWKKDHSITDEQRRIVSQKAKEFRQTYIENLKKEIGDVLAPHGLMYLNLLRERYDSSSLPIMIYTRAGPYILEEFQIEQVYQNNATFLIKYYDSALKNYLIRRCIERDRLFYDAFISYSSTDREIAMELFNNLNNLKSGSFKMRCFMSEKTISAGETWTEKVRKAIQSSKLIIILLTPNSLRSDWVMAEAGAGWAMRKPVIPATMLIEVSKVPVIISQFQMRPFETEEQRGKLIEEVYRLAAG